MHQSYTDIYDKRGEMYHEAMERWPDARKLEFETLVGCAAIDQTCPLVLDVPSGGGYLANYLPTGARLVSVDPAPTFLHAGSHDKADQVLCASHDAIPLADAAADVVFSLAGLHHIEDQAGVFREWYRLLKSGGVLVIGDAESGSATAAFLDGVVGQFNTMGHHGKYLTAVQVEMLRETGFEVTVAEVKAYSWLFRDRGTMLDYCRTLFCMDRCPDDETLISAIERTIGFREEADGCHMNWALFFIRAHKP